MSEEESRHARFRRIARVRVRRVLEAYEGLKKTSHRGRYVYTAQEAEQIRMRLQVGLDEACGAFAEPTEEPVFDWESEQDDENP